MSKKTQKAASAGRPTGKTTGLGVQAAWAHCFKQNGNVKAGDRLTDAEITKWMNREFPGRNSAIFNAVTGVRRKYNLGGLTKGEIPKKQSVAYDEDGNVAKKAAKAAAPAPKAKVKAKKKTEAKATKKPKAKKRRAAATA